DRRQPDDRRVRSERLTEVHHRQRSVGQCVHQLREESRAHDRRLRANWIRFSSSDRSVTYDDGPTGSNLATMVVRSPAPSASSNARVKASSPKTRSVRGTPAAAAMAARSLPVAVAVGKPPTDSRLSLSKITW